MLVRFTFLLFVLSTAIGCTIAPSPVIPTALLSVTATTPVARIPDANVPVVSILALTDSDTLHPNDTLKLELKLEPWLFTREQSSTSLKADPNSPAREMRVCVQFDTPCQPTGDWIPYQKNYSTTLPVDWLGKRDLFVFANFRDANGKPIPSANELQSPDRPPAESLTLDSTLDARTPEAAQPAFVQTAIAATRVAFPVTGSLELQNGNCCAGGKVASSITITANFSATTSQGTVTEMRILTHCATAEEMETAAWEPFTAQKTYPYTIAVANWVGWYLAVQYRDDKGNLSPIYCDDISIEGMP